MAKPDTNGTELAPDDGVYPWPDDGPYDTSAGKPVAAGAVFLGVGIGLLVVIPIWLLLAFALRTFAL